MRRLRDDRGLSLVEVVTAIGILSLVVPMLVVAVMSVLGTVAFASRSASASTERSLLQTHFTGDVAEATAVVAGGTSCAPPLDGAAHTVHVTFTVPGGSVSYVTGGQRIEPDGSTSSLLLRVDCSVSPVRQTIVSAVAEGALPDFACSTSASGDACRTIRLTVPHVDGSTVLSATRRVS